MSGVFILRGFNNPALNEVYTANSAIVIGGVPTYWDRNGNHFMYHKARWVISPRFEDTADMLVEVQRGEMRGMAYESDGSWWQEYINDQWHRVQIEFTKLVVEANSSMPRPLPVSVPQPCPDTLAQKSAHVDTSRTALSSSGLPCSAVPSHPPQPPPLQRTALQSTSGAGAVFGGQVDTVVIKGFRNADLNGTYLVDAAIQAGGRATYWNQVHSHFLYYQLAEQRWAICRYESGEHDTLQMHKMAECGA